MIVYYIDYMNMIDNPIRNAFRDTPLWDLVRSARNEYLLLTWNKVGPPPHIYKQRLVKSYGRKFGFSTLIETGTYQADMAYAVRNCFKKIYTIEISPEFLKVSRLRLARFPQVECLEGDSGVLLPKLLASIQEPCLFWLDGHYSGVGMNYNSGDSETPLMQELEAIFRHSVKKHGVLIDDAHCFDGTKGYPTMEKLIALIKERLPEHSFEVQDNIIRIMP